MNLVIHEYGYIDAMFYILNAIAMVTNSKFGEGIIVITSMISAAYYSMRISYAGSADYKVYMGKVAGMFAIITFLLSPTTDMIIKDRVKNSWDKVDNLPMGFALPVGLFEAFGDLVTTCFEQAFTPVGDANYGKYGMVFGARLVREARDWRIRTPEFLENMSAYIDRCVVTEAMIGYNFTPQDLIKSDNIWKTVTDAGVVLRKIPVRIGKEKKIVACKDAARDILEPAFEVEIASLENRYKHSDFSLAGHAGEVRRTFERLNSNLKNNTALAFKSYLGSSSNAESIMRQQMMVNALNDFNDNYGYTRASRTQESNWAVAGDLASVGVPILLSAFKGLAYSAFVFLIPLMITSGGWAKYKDYLTLIASFQLWAALNAVLNMFITLYSSYDISDATNKIVTFSTSSKIGNYSDKIVFVAYGLQVFVPWLAFTIMKGGVGAFVHLSGLISGATQQAASQAANESSTGNKSFDNYSAGNKQLYNESGFKTDYNRSYASGASTYQHSDGSMEKVTAGGNTLIQSGAGFTDSTGASNYRHEQNRHAQVNEGSQNSEALQEHDTRSLSDAKSQQFAKSADAIMQIAQREHSGQTVNYEEMGEHGKAVHDTARTATEEYKRNGNDWEKAATLALNASAGTKILGTGVTLEGTASTTYKGNDSTGESNTTSTDKGSTENYNNVVKALSGNSWARDNNIDSSYSEGVRESTENVKRAEQQLSISSQKVDDWHKAKSIMESEGAASSTENYQEIVDGVKKEYGVDVKSAQEMASRRTPEAMNVWSKIQKEDHYVENLMNKIASDRQSVSGENAVNRLNEFSNNASNQVSGELSGKVKTRATDNGLNIDQAKSNIKTQEAKLNKQFNEVQNDTDNQYKDGTKKRNLEAVNMSSQVNQNKIIPTQNSSNSKIVGMGFEKGENIEPSDLSKQINSFKKKT